MLREGFRFYRPHRSLQPYIRYYWVFRSNRAGKDMLPAGRKMKVYDRLAVCTIVADSKGGVSSCDIPFSWDIQQFNSDYMRLTRQVAMTAASHDLEDGYMVIGTSALAQYEIDGAVGMYSGIHFFRPVQNDSSKSRKCVYLPM